MSALEDATKLGVARKAAMSHLTTAVVDGIAALSAVAAKVLTLLGTPDGAWDPVVVEALATEMQARAEVLKAAVAADAKPKPVADVKPAVVDAKPKGIFA